MGKALLDPSESSFNKIYVNYKRNAAKRGIFFGLDKGEFKKLTRRLCHYCGARPTMSYKRDDARKAYKYNGVDRLNNLLGYVKENCVPCCAQCNNNKGASNPTLLIRAAATLLLQLFPATALNKA